MVRMSERRNTERHEGMGVDEYAQYQYLLTDKEVAVNDRKNAQHGFDTSAWPE